MTPHTGHVERAMPGGNLPVIDVGGTVYEAGVDLGRQLKDMLAEMAEQLKKKVSVGFPGGWSLFQRRARIYQAYVENFLPRDHEEMYGISEGSGLPIETLYSLTCLELREQIVEMPKGCSDFILGTRATASGQVLACHNEDWEADEQQFLVVRRSQVEGEPRTMSISYGGIIPSIGFNDRGLSLTGNALSPNDKRFGVPKLHIVREIIRSESLGKALELCALEPRASSFNNALATSDGQLYNFEGSATDFALTFSTEYSVHTNHYLAERMHKYEADRTERVESVLRYHTVADLVKAHYGEFTVETCQQILGNHLNAPNSPCRHQAVGEGCTVFSAVINLSDLVMHACVGNPCTSDWQSYSLDSNR